MNAILRVAVLSLPPSRPLICRNRPVPEITLFHVEIIKMVTTDIVYPGYLNSLVHVRHSVKFLSIIGELPWNAGTFISATDISMAFSCDFEQISLSLILLNKVMVKFPQCLIN
jgi:hypothetical protein